ncbi:MAG: hypothetical protein ACE5HA_14765, partial [Anaerolineae bacterium]
AGFSATPICARITHVEENRLGVIDSLSAGLNLIAERPWVVAIPVLLDLWYWRGPRLSVAPLFKQIEQFLAQSMPATMPQGPVDFKVVQEMLATLGQRSNLFSLLSATVLGVPSLMAGGDSGNAGIIEIRSWLVLAGAGALLMLAGLAIGCLYLTLILQGVEEERIESVALLNRAGTLWVRVVALLLLILFFAIALAVPFSFLLSLLTFVSSAAVSFLAGVFYMAIIWLGLYLYFVVYAIMVNRVGPIRAIWNSANVVARNFWSALVLVILIIVLTQGLALVWQRLGQANPIGMIIGIAGNAFIGSGLVAASLLFYRDRYQRWQEQRLEIGD